MMERTVDPREGPPSFKVPEPDVLSICKGYWKMR